MTLTKLGASVAFAASATTAMAGGIDRTNLSISPLFEDGNYAELSFAHVSPDVPGTILGLPLSLSQSATSFNMFGFAYKHQFNENLSFAIIADQPYGSQIEYAEIPGLAIVETQTFTGALRYEMGNGFSAHAGVRAEKLTGEILSSPGYIDATGDYEIGGLIGVAYERPEIALRVALTYYSSIDHELDGLHNGVATVATFSMPERINLDFQTGIAADTLLFGSISHAKWDGASLDSTGGVNWVTFSEDSTAYSLGIGRKLSDELSASISLGYEEASNTGTTLLAPTGTSKSVALGLSYRVTETVKISGGVRYTDFSDKTVTTMGTGPVLFTGGNAVSVGLKLGVSF